MNPQAAVPVPTVRLVQNVVRHRKAYYVVTTFKVAQDRKLFSAKTTREPADTPHTGKLTWAGD